MDIHEVATAIAAAGGGGGVRFRQGTVVSVQSDGTITATIAGSTISVTGIKCWASAVPEPGHGVWLATDGVDLIAVGTIGGPTSFPGEVKMYAGAGAPPGWLLCDGSAVSRATYAALFAAIGTTFGSGDGSTTFNLPDARDRFPVGAGSSYAVGAKGGEATHVLTQPEMPSHTHSVSAVGASAGSSINTGSGNKQLSIQTGSVGSDNAHENRPPYLALTFVIRT